MAEPGLRCPQCGGEVRPEEEDDCVPCPFCGSRLYVDPGQAVRHFTLAPAVQHVELPPRLDRWLRSREVVGRPRKVTSKLVYFPFWALPTHGSIHAVPAAALLAVGTEHLHIPAGDLKAYPDDLEAKAKVVPATVLLDAVLARARPKPDGAPVLVHVPFWDTRFQLATAAHRVWIDAAQGQVLAFSLPHSSEVWRDRLYSTVMALTYGVLLAGFACIYAGRAYTARGLLMLALGGPLGWAAARLVIGRTERTERP